MTSIHHPISVDRRIELAAAGACSPRSSKRRWYGFVRMQARVARRLRPDPDRLASPPATTSAATSGSGPNTCASSRWAWTPGCSIRADAAPGAGPDRGGGQRRLADQGGRHAAARGRQARHRTRRAPDRGGQARAGRPDRDSWSRELSLADRVRFVHGISDDELAELLASAEIAVVPSLYEGFSLPAVEHMASGTPLVASRTGALPEVTGDAAVLVAPGDDEELAAVLRRLHDSPAERDAAGRPGAATGSRERFAWPAVARRPPSGSTWPRWTAPASRRDRHERTGRVLTVDFRRFPVRPGDRVLDLGCGGGRHAFEVLPARRGRRGLRPGPGRAGARWRRCSRAMRTAGEVPPRRRGRDRDSGDAHRHAVRRRQRSTG